MAAEIFKGGNLRLILDTETDADSPISETLMNAVRYYSENILILGWSTGDTGFATSNPPNDATGVLTDTNAAYGVDEHNGRTLVMTSGNAKGNAYTIDDTTATTVVATGDNLYADGVRSADYYEVFYDILVNRDGHNHDGINSAKVVLADDQVTTVKILDANVTQAKLKTSMSAVSQAVGGSSFATLPGGTYGFYPQIKKDGAASGTANISIAYASAGVPTTYTASIYLDASAMGGTGSIYAQQRYVTASGDIHWIFMLKDKLTGKTISVYEAPDHPCFGNGNRPEIVPHPFGSYDPKKHEIIVINPTREQVQDATARTVPIVGGGYLTADTLLQNEYEVDGLRPERDLIQVFSEDFATMENKDALWPDIPITVGLPTVSNGKIMNNYLYKAGDIVTPIRVVIEKPDYITPLEMRLKDAK